MLFTIPIHNYSLISFLQIEFLVPLCETSLQYLDDYPDFTQAEMDQAGSLAPKSLKTLNDMMKDPHEMSLLKTEMTFITDRCEQFVCLLRSPATNSGEVDPVRANRVD